MKVLFNINSLNTEEMEKDYLANKIAQAERSFEEWIDEKASHLSIEQKTILGEKMQLVKNAVKPTIDKAAIEFNSIIETVEQIKDTFPGSKKVIEYTESKAKEIFEKALDESWDFLKNQIFLLIPKSRA
jgi:hypothetical protein